MLEPNADITGSEYFNTAPDDKLERVSPIVCGKVLVDETKKSISATKNVLNILFIQIVNKGKYHFKNRLLLMK